jgi:4-aminobutyrate aminotransferase-like enzyme
MSSSSAAGNAPACAAGLATLEVIESEGLCARAARSGERLLAALDALAREFAPIVTGASGRGLLLALHTDGPRSAARLIAACARRGLLVMSAFCDRTRVLLDPPLGISDEQADFAVAALREGLREMRGLEH